MKTVIKNFISSSAITIIVSILPSIASATQSADSLPSWTNRENKKAIIEFVQKVVKPGSKSYVAPADRIATLDMDGTIIVEKPGYAITDFLTPKLKEQTQKNPELLKRPNIKAFIDKNWAYFDHVDIHAPNGIYATTLESFPNKTEKEFLNASHQFFFEQKHPHYHVPYAKTVYQPMVELIHYLQKNNFQVYICTGNDTSFIRSMSQKTLNIPPQNVIGTQVLTKWQEHNQHIDFIRQSIYVQPINDRTGKAVNILKIIGKQPILAIGNSRGDMEMLNFAKDAKPGVPNLEMVVVHDDKKREYEYSVDKMKQLAVENGWRVISIKHDFKKLFEFE